MKLFRFVFIFFYLINSSALMLSRGAFVKAASTYLTYTMLSHNSDNSDKVTLIESSNHNIDTPLTINYYGQVTTESCMQLSQALKHLDKESKQHHLVYNHQIPIKLHIQSLGGELMPSFYICDLIRNLDTPVYTYIDGFAASAASLIAVCGDKRFMTQYSSILIHQLSASSAGKYNEMKDELSNLSLFMENLKEIYLEKSRLKEEELDSLLKSDLWLPSEKALTYGLVDEIL